MLTVFCLLSLAVAAWLVGFALGQFMMLVFPACAGDEVLRPEFPRHCWRPVLTLGVIGLVLGVVLAIPALRFLLDG